jgi:hypothetical protein
VQFNPGDLVRYTYDVLGEVGQAVEKQLTGLVLRSVGHYALVLLNGRPESGWIDHEVLEVLSESR